MLKRKLAVVVTCLLAGASTTVFAAKGGGSGGSGTPGGTSSAHMSSSGQRNTNGPAAADRDKGLQRAEDRMSATGASHEKAHHAKAKGKRHRSQAPRTGR